MANHQPFQLRTLTGATTTLCLKKVIPKEQTDALRATGLLKCPPDGPDQWRLGLREDTRAAVDRVSMIRPQGRPVTGTPTQDTHDVLEIHFTPLGIAHFTQMCQGAEYGFGSLLSKQTYNDRLGTDHKVWHFHGDLPLHAVDENGGLLIFTTIAQIPP